MPALLKDGRAQARKTARKLLTPNCERCGTIKRLQAHHVDNDIMNNNPSNVMTLCRPCHTKWHWEHGKTMPAKRGLCRLCKTAEMGHGLCEKHLTRQRRHGDPLLKKVNMHRIWTLVKVGPYD